MQGICLDDLSRPRILWEFEKLFHAPFLHYGLFYMYTLNIFEKCFTCNVPKRFLSIAKELIRSKSNFQKTLQAYYFFYIVANRLGVNPLEWFKRLDAPNHYLTTFKNQPFFDGEMSDEELYHVSLDKPISLWLGHYREGIEQRAKVLGVWDEAFNGGISVQEVIHDGFTHKAIGLELRRRKIEKIKQLCEA